MPTVVLLPGMDGTGTLFEPFVTALSGRFRSAIVRYPADRPMDYAGHVAYARALLPADEPYVLLGESFSGPVAVSLAAERPAGLRGLILCASFIRNPRPFFGGLRPLARVMPIPLAPLSLLRAYVMGEFVNEELRDHLVRAISRVSPAVLRARLAAVLDADVADQFAVLTLPILYLRATEDRVVPLAASTLVARANPHVQMVDIHAPHFLMQAAPADAARAVDSFLHAVQNGHATKN